MQSETAKMIMLSDIWSIENPRDYKVHFARYSRKDNVQPLDVLARDADEWWGWQEYRPERNEFNRDFIFSLAQFYHETDSWLFGGIFRVTGRPPGGYEVELTAQGAPFIGRLKLGSHYRSRPTRPNMENHFDQFEVLEILREPYTGRPFPGYENIDLPFHELQTLTHNDRPDWRTALENVKGVYLITVHTAPFVHQYVGAAYGEHGIWSRWNHYSKTGDGGNAKLGDLMGEGGLDYCRQHFRFALLEHMPRNTLDETVQARESRWKEILGTRRGSGGFNEN